MKHLTNFELEKLSERTNYLMHDRGDWSLECRLYRFLKHQMFDDVDELVDRTADEATYVWNCPERKDELAKIIRDAVHYYQTFIKPDDDYAYNIRKEGHTL